MTRKNSWQQKIVKRSRRSTKIPFAKYFISFCWRFLFHSVAKCFSSIRTQCSMRPGTCEWHSHAQPQMPNSSRRQKSRTINDQIVVEVSECMQAIVFYSIDWKFCVNLCRNVRTDREQNCFDFYAFYWPTLNHGAFDRFRGSRKPWPASSIERYHCSTTTCARVDCARITATAEARHERFSNQIYAGSGSTRYNFPADLHTLMVSPSFPGLHKPSDRATVITRTRTRVSRIFIVEVILF